MNNYFIQLVPNNFESLSVQNPFQSLLFRIGLTSIEAINGEHLQLNCCDSSICLALEDEHGGK
jgi:hypothetical protein